MIDNIKFWIDLHQDVFKTIISLVLICALIVLIPSVPRWIRNSFALNHNVQTEAIVQEIITKEGIVETVAGGKVKENAYEIAYSFEYNDVIYQNREFIKSNFIKPKYRIQLKYLEKSDTIQISFSDKNPQNAMLKLE